MLCRLKHQADPTGVLRGKFRSPSGLDESGESLAHFERNEAEGI